MKVSWLVLVVVILLAMCVFRVTLPEATAADGSGAYAIYSAGDYILLLDSNSGRSWQLMEEMRRTTEWVPIRRR